MPGVLTEGLGRPELQRSGVGGEFGGAQRRRLTGARGGGAAEALQRRSGLLDLPDRLKVILRNGERD